MAATTVLVNAFRGLASSPPAKTPRVSWVGGWDDESREIREFQHQIGFTCQFLFKWFYLFSWNKPPKISSHFHHLDLDDSCFPAGQVPHVQTKALVWHWLNGNLLDGVPEGRFRGRFHRACQPLTILILRILRFKELCKSKHLKHVHISV